VSDHLDFLDTAAVAAWLSGLKQSFDDLDGAASDMLRPPEQRELGPVLHTKHYTEARAQVLHALDYAGAPEDEGPKSGPRPGGGAR
jgi:hypothetical protein